MPELPEAETIVRGLDAGLPGRRIRVVEVIHEDVLRQDRDVLAQRTSDRTVERVERRGKNVIVRLSGSGVLAVNLGMTGRLLIFDREPASAGAPTHPAVRWRFYDGTLLVFDDVRRFGTVECLDPEEWETRSARMGPEPLSSRYSARDLHGALRRSRAPVRSWLLDQRRIAGVGNIYANEALYLSGIDPRTPAHDIGLDPAIRLHRSLRRVLRNAIRAGGTTLRDYRTTRGDKGHYGRTLQVYDRAGSPCRKCGTTIERIVFSNRSAFLCPRCQPAPGTRDG